MLIRHYCRRRTLTNPRYHHNRKDAYRARVGRACAQAPVNRSTPRSQTAVQNRPKPRAMARVASEVEVLPFLAGSAHVFGSYCERHLVNGYS